MTLPNIIPSSEKAKKIVRLLITPQTHVRSTQGDSKCFRIPEKVLLEKYPSLYKRKMQLEKYNKYKDALKIEALRQGFDIPKHSIWIKFYMPMPKSWSARKRTQMNFMPKLSTPDLDNLTKAFKDGLLKQDSSVWDYRVSKFWYDAERGFIEIEFL